MRSKRYRARQINWMHNDILSELDDGRLELRRLAFDPYQTAELSFLAKTVVRLYRELAHPHRDQVDVLRFLRRRAARRALEVVG